MRLLRRKTQARQPLPSDKIPVGVFLKTEKGYFFVQSEKSRYRLTPRCLESWSPQRVLHCSEEDQAVSRLRVTAKMKFRNGSLIWSMSTGRLYFIEAGKKRLVTSPDSLTMLGYKPDEGIVVDLDELNMHEDGEDL